MGRSKSPEAQRADYWTGVAWPVSDCKLAWSYKRRGKGREASLETFLRGFASACPKSWSSWLSLAEFWYNTSFHSAIGRSPFEAMYGRPPRHLGLSVPKPAASPSLTQWLQDRKVVTDLIKQHLNRAATRMKWQADKNRSERQFSEGDWIFLKLQPYIQSSLAPRANQKLAFKFFGPFKVLQRFGSVAYKLDLPQSSLVHPVFHVSQLKQAVGSKYPVTPVVPDGMLHMQVPEKVLQRRLVARSKKSVMQVLVKWSSLSESLATWEDLEAVRQHFPLAPAWRQPASKGGGSVRTTTTGAETEEGVGAQIQSGVMGCSKRVRRPNVRTTGLEWHGP
jgi:hypothetical protein